MHLYVHMYQFRNQKYFIVQAKMLKKVNGKSSEKASLCKNINQEQIINNKTIDKEIKNIYNL